MLRSFLKKLNAKFDIESIVDRIITGDMPLKTVVSHDAFNKALKAFENLTNTNESVLVQEGFMDFVQSAKGVAVAFALIAGLAILSGSHPTSIGELEVTIANAIKGVSMDDAPLPKFGDMDRAVAGAIKSISPVNPETLVKASVGGGTRMSDDLDRHVEKAVDRHVEKAVDRHVEKAVDRHVDTAVDEPVPDEDPDTAMTSADEPVPSMDKKTTDSPATPYTPRVGTGTRLKDLPLVDRIQLAREKISSRFLTPEQAIARYRITPDEAAQFHLIPAKI